MKRKVTIVLSVLVLLIASCEMDGTTPCIEERNAAAIISNFPDSIKVGNTHLLDVTYLLESDCGKFERFDVSATGKSFEVRLITKYTGCNCKALLIETKTTFDINLDFPGIYEYRFWQADGDYDTRTVTIFE